MLSQIYIELSPKVSTPTRISNRVIISQSTQLTHAFCHASATSIVRISLSWALGYPASASRTQLLSYVGKDLETPATSDAQAHVQSLCRRMGREINRGSAPFMSEGIVHQEGALGP